MALVALKTSEHKKVAEAAYLVSATPEGQILLDWLNEHTDEQVMKKDTNGTYDPLHMAARVGMRKLYLEIKRKIADGERNRKP